MDCFCLLCEPCEGSVGKAAACPLCKKATKHCKIEAGNKQQMSPIAYLFSNIEGQLTKSIEVCKFQFGQAHKYIAFLEAKNRLLEETLNNLLTQSPQLAGLVHSRVPFIEFFKTERSYSDHPGSKMPTRAFDQSRANSERQSIGRLFKVPTLNADTAGSNRRRDDPHCRARPHY
jgi:hypothetical protein